MNEVNEVIDLQFPMTFSTLLVFYLHKRNPPQPAFIYWNAYVINIKICGLIVHLVCNLLSSTHCKAMPTRPFYNVELHYVLLTIYQTDRKWFKSATQISKGIEFFLR